MVDIYTKVVLTVIAVALVWIGFSPIIAPSGARAADPMVVRVDGPVRVEGDGTFGAVRVDCDSAANETDPLTQRSLTASTVKVFFTHALLPFESPSRRLRSFLTKN